MDLDRRRIRRRASATVLIDMNASERRSEDQPIAIEPARPSRLLQGLRIALGLVGIGAVVLLVRHVGVHAVMDALAGSLAWLPALCALEFLRIVCETAATYFAFGKLASHIPRGTLLHAHVLGHSIGAVAPAPSVVNETIKATLLVPFVGAGPATSVAFINQSATLMSVGFVSIPCGIAIYLLGGASIWFWACMVHGVVLSGCGVGLQAITRSETLRRLHARIFPKRAHRMVAFRAHATEGGLFASRTTGALIAGRVVLIFQLGVAAYAVGIHANLLRAMAVEGVYLLAATVGVLIPAGLGTTDGALTLASHLLDTAAARATSLALLVRCVQIVWVAIALLVAPVHRVFRGDSAHVSK
jgi:hypothetical protein